MCSIQVLKFRTWETRLFKMPHFQTGMRVTVASGLSSEKKSPLPSRVDLWHSC